jgi:tripartite-type tricarboxylate transporter receptor subunit TctC
VKTLKDPAVVDEAKKAKMDLEILTGAEVEAQIRDVMSQPKDVIERVKKLSE